MMKRQILIMAYFGLFTVGCSQHAQHVGIPAGTAPFDERFLVWLVNHHNDDDRMVGPCAKKDSIHAELRAFCATVDQQHLARIERERNWLKEWYGRDLPQTDNLPLWLGTLEGHQFEDEFFKEYVHQHADALEPLKECNRRATHAELRELCQKIEQGQQKQMTQVQRWQCEWSKKCN